MATVTLLEMAPDRTDVEVSEVRVHPEFRRLFESELAYVMRTLRRLGVPERDVADVSQDVFVAVHGAFAGYDASRPARPWLFSFAFRVTANHKRLARHRHELLDGGSAVEECVGVPDRGDPSEQLEVAEQRELLVSALAALPLERRAVVIACELDGMSAPEVAALFDVPLNTVYSRLRVGRTELARAVRRLAAGGPT